MSSLTRRVSLLEAMLRERDLELPPPDYSPMDIKTMQKRSDPQENQERHPHAPAYKQQDSLHTQQTQDQYELPNISHEESTSLEDGATTYDDMHAGVVDRVHPLERSSHRF